MRQKRNPQSPQAWRHRARADFRLAILSKMPSTHKGDLRRLKYAGAIHHIDFDPSNNANENLHYFETREKHNAFHLRLRNFVYNFIQANKDKIIFRASDKVREKNWTPDPKRNKEKCKKYRLENPTHNKEYYLTHLEKIKAYRNAYKKSHRDKFAYYQRQYRLRKKVKESKYGRTH